MTYRIEQRNQRFILLLIFGGVKSTSFLPDLPVREILGESIQLVPFFTLPLAPTTPNPSCSRVTLISTALETINSKLEGLIDLVSNNLFHLKSMPPGSVVSECWGFNLSPTLTSQSKSSSSVIFTSSIPRERSVSWVLSIAILSLFFIFLRLSLILSASLMILFVQPSIFDIRLTSL